MLLMGSREDKMLENPDVITDGCGMKFIFNSPLLSEKLFITPFGISTDQGNDAVSISI